MKHTLIEMKNNLQGNNSRVDEAKNQINDLEHKEAKKTIRTTRRKKNPKNKDSISSLWDNSKRPNICIVEAPDSEQEMGNVF